MKRFVWLVVILLIAAPGWAAKKMTVQQLKDLLAADQKSQKSDADVAGELKDVELTEEMTHGTMDSFKPLVPGQLTTEQLFVLEIRSAVLAPPASEIPATAARQTQPNRKPSSTRPLTTQRRPTRKCRP